MSAEIVECTTCMAMFRDTDGTHVCPLGHENDWVQDELDAELQEVFA